MAKVTSKLQVTIPRHLAREYGISPGDEVQWSAAGDAIRIAPASLRHDEPVSVELRLKLFDAATERQRKRQRGKRKERPPRDRGWTREDLYDRDRTR